MSFDDTEHQEHQDEDLPVDMGEQIFIDLWTKQLWDLVAGGAAHMGLDLDAIRTDPNCQEAQAAGRALFRLTQKYPAFLGWMRSDLAAKTSDLALVGMFFGAKIWIIKLSIELAREKAAQEHQEQHQAEAAPDTSETSAPSASKDLGIAYAV